MSSDFLLSQQGPVLRIKAQVQTFPFPAISESVKIACVRVAFGHPLDTAPTAPIFLFFPEDGQDLVFEGVTASPLSLRKGSGVCLDIESFNFLDKSFPCSFSLTLVVCTPPSEETTQGPGRRNPSVKRTPGAANRSPCLLRARNKHGAEAIYLEPPSFKVEGWASLDPILP